MWVLGQLPPKKIPPQTQIVTLTWGQHFSRPIIRTPFIWRPAKIQSNTFKIRKTFLKPGIVLTLSHLPLNFHAIRNVSSYFEMSHKML